MDYLYYLFATLIFVAVVLLIEGVYLTWNSSKGPEAERISRRLRLMSAGGNGDEQNISIIKERLLSKAPTMQRLLLQLPRVGSLDRLLQQSGLSWSVADFLGMSLIAFLSTLFAASYLAMPWPLRLALAAACALLPVLYVTRAKGKRLVRIEQQRPDALDLMGRWPSCPCLPRAGKIPCSGPAS